MSLRHPAIRLFAALWLALLASGYPSGQALAQDPPMTVMLQRGADDATVGETLRAAAATGRPVLIEWTDATTPASLVPPGAAPTPATSVPVSPPAMISTSGLDAGAAADMLRTRFVLGLSLGWAGMSSIAAVLSGVSDDIAREGQSVGFVLSAAVGATAAGMALAVLIRKGIGLVLRRRRPVVDMLNRLRAATGHLLLDGLVLAGMAILLHLVLSHMLPPASVSLDAARSLVAVSVVTAAYAIVGRFLLSPSRAVLRLLPLPHPRWHWGMIVAVGAVSSLIGESVRFASRRGLDAAAVEGFVLIGATVLTVVKLVWFIAGRRNFRTAFAGSRPGPVRRAIAFCLPEFYAVTAVVLWIVGCVVAGTPRGAVWGRAAGATQLILLVLPVLALGFHALAGTLLRRRADSSGDPVRAAIAGSIQTACAGTVWLVGLHAIVLLWQPVMASEETFGMVVLLDTLERISLAVVASWVLCSFLWHCFEAYGPANRLALPGEEQDGPAQPSSRLSTVLPLLRNLAFGAILAVTGLVVLSSLGVDVAPLLAGFGVLGLALSFGSQALVKDVVSGIFFIADDAFRVGEYVDTGKLKGTVERISLRSLRLRHQNGQIHTIPFGQLQAVTNFSRDWSTIKFELRFDRDADPERIRKTVKKIGLELLADPVLGPEFLVPLKMQGIQDVTETSLVIRLKFTARPGNPTILQREAMKRLLPALRLAGLQLASNAVTVRGGGDAAAETAAAVMSRKAAEGLPSDPAEQA